MPNALQFSLSPYLLQHADNPVEWFPWGEEALQKAKSEDKPILLSIGYSSCHWCHVMAHGSFEDMHVATIMNQHYVNIKLDREERPDIDHIYMEAIQAMGLHGGWPLNVFLLPDGKPFYGGTYFPKSNWIQLLQSVANAYQHHRNQLIESADQFAQVLNQSVSNKYLSQPASEVHIDQLRQAVHKLSGRFDLEWGGMKKAPKFPMPAIWNMLYHVSSIHLDEKIERHLDFSLKKMANGGIYDHIGGGFSRYSVDGEWHVPHFEKMLYDNAQLLSLYAFGYKKFKRAVYLDVLNETIEWLQREMMHPSGAFYAALDADSEGIEGKFYVWEKSEIAHLAGQDVELISTYFDVSESGNWEETNVLRIIHDQETIASTFKITEAELIEIIKKFKSKALTYRDQRIRPGLDDKLIAGWNGLLLSGLTHAYQIVQNVQTKKLCVSLYQGILSQFIKDEKVLHVNTLDTEGFADDYAAVIQGLLDYCQTFDAPDALRLAAKLTQNMTSNFWNDKEQLFNYTGNSSEQLIANHIELFDNVIPASNSIMALNLIKLGLLTYHDNNYQQGKQMIERVMPLILREPEYLSNWAVGASYLTGDVPEIIIVGDEAEKLALQFHQIAVAAKVILPVTTQVADTASADKVMYDSKTTIYVCYNRACQRPVHTVEDALSLLPKHLH